MILKLAERHIRVHQHGSVTEKLLSDCRGGPCRRVLPVTQASVLAARMCEKT